MGLLLFNSKVIKIILGYFCYFISVCYDECETYEKVKCCNIKNFKYQFS